MKFLFLLLLGFFYSLTSYAAFTSDAPPTWRANPNGSGGFYGPNGNPFYHGNAAWFKYMQDLKTPGANRKVPWYMKMSPSAGAYFAAKAFTPASLGLIALPFVIDWLAGQGVGYDKGKWVTADYNNSNIDGFEYSAGNGWHNKPFKACDSIIANLRTYWALPDLATSKESNADSCRYSYTTNGVTQTSGLNVHLTRRSHPCPSGWEEVSGVCVASSLVPMTQPEFIEKVSPLVWPEGLPDKLPFGLPVDDPVFNPRTAPDGVPDPFYSPTGLPYPSPAPRPIPDPTPWTEPGVKVTPAPKPAPDPDPWNKDERPVNKPLPDPNPTPPDTGTPVPEPVTTEPEKDPGLCAMFPDILACEELGDAPESPELPDKEVDLSITPMSGFGSNNGSCPADKMVAISFIGRTIPITFSYVCQLASGVRPVVLALAWLSAAFIVLGMGRKS